MSWCCCCLFRDVVPSLKAGGDPIPWAQPGLCWRCHGAGSSLAQPQTLGSSNHWGPSHFQPPAALVKRKNGNNGHGPMGVMMIVFSWKKKKKKLWGKRGKCPHLTEFPLLCLDICPMGQQCQDGKDSADVRGANLTQTSRGQGYPTTHLF